MPSEQQNYDVFISYSHEDLDFASRLRKDLASEGYSIFFPGMDRRQVGAEWNTQIERIRACKVFIAVLFPGFAHSEIEKNEVRFAASAGCRILPVIHGFEDVPDVLSYTLGELQLVNMDGANYSSGLKEVLKFVKQSIAAVNEPDAPDPEDIRKLLDILGNLETLEKKDTGTGSPVRLLNSKSEVLSQVKYTRIDQQLEYQSYQIAPSPGQPQTETFKTPWGKDLTAQAEDFILSKSAHSDVFWPVDRQRFESTFIASENPGLVILKIPLLLVPLPEVNGNQSNMDITVETAAGRRTVCAGDYYLARTENDELWVIENGEADKYIYDAAEEKNRQNNNHSQAMLNDLAHGADLLGIQKEVEALAESLLLRDVEPPLAVGIMGGWGSGKSFVMHLIEKYVEEIRVKPVKKGWPDPEQKKNEKKENEEKKKKDPSIPAFAGHIYQVHFNAWTYAKSDLWASLMDTIFTSLNRQMQLERLFAYQDLEAKDPSNPGPDNAADEQERVRLATQVCNSMLNGGELFKKIYKADYQISQDDELEPKTKERLTFWSERLLSQNMLWQVMRNQNETDLKVMRKDEQELEQYKARRTALDMARHSEAVSTNILDEEIAKPAYFSLLQATLLEFVTDSFGKAIRDNLKNTELKPDDLVKLEENTHKLLEGKEGFVDALRRNRYYWLAAASVAGIAIAFPFVWNHFAITPINHAFGFLVGLASTAAPFFPTLKDRWHKIVQFEAETRKAFENAYEAQQTRKAEEIAAANLPVNEKIRRLDAEVKKGSLPACDVLIRIKENHIEQQRRKIGPAARYANLLEFVQSRLDAATYENQLGLMHQVCKDIAELTYSLVSSANRDIFPRGKPRVLLYIDDLDRCPPRRVVEILEAVQLLLNTKLFVIILGLDTRYVTRALEKEYKEILQHEGDPSGLDYIEKIIQIPYRVRPIEHDSLPNYLAKQMEIETQPEQEQDSVPQPGNPSLPVTPAHGSFVPATSQSSIDTGAEGSQETVVRKDKVETKKIEIELPAVVVQFKRQDLEDLTICCQQISLTPRSIKRVVNVFKLMKIFWFRADQETGRKALDRPRPVRQAAICLLALASAYPEVTREVFVNLDGLYHQGQVQTHLLTALNNIKLPPGTSNELAWQLQRYKRDVAALDVMPGDNVEGTLDRLTLAELTSSTFNIIRSFSFVGDPVYWTNVAEGHGPNGRRSVGRHVKLKRNAN